MALKKMVIKLYLNKKTKWLVSWLVVYHDDDGNPEPLIENN